MAVKRSSQQGTTPRPARQSLSEVTALMAAASRSLAEAELVTRPAERYAFAHLAALRATAAILAARARPVDSGRRSRPRNAWALLTEVAPEMSEWAAFFAAGAGKRAAAEAGLAGAVTDRDADDLLRDAGTFLALAATTLGLPDQTRLPLPA